MNRDQVVRIDDLDAALALLSVMSDLYPRLDEEHKVFLIDKVFN